MEEYYDIAIIGSGCSGASIALELAESLSSNRIIWFQGTARITASTDVNKIVRTVYRDKDYEELAEEALKEWMNNNLFRPFFHPVSWVQAVKEGSLRSSMRTSDDESISSAEFVKLSGSREYPVLEVDEQLWINRKVGSADISLAISAIAREVETRGVIPREVDVNQISLTIAEGGRGITLEDGSTIFARQTIIAAGPWSPALLERSGLPSPKEFWQPCAVGVATIKIDEADTNATEKMPISLNDEGEAMRYRVGRLLKFTTTHTVEIKHPDEVKAAAASWDITPNLRIQQKFFPQYNNAPTEQWVCCDLVTKEQHPLIDKIPGFGDIIVAAGWSFHGAKFLTYTGKLVLARMTGQMEPNSLISRVLKKMSWDQREGNTSIHRSIVPKTNWIRSVQKI